MNYTAITHPLNNYILAVLSLSVLVQGLGRTEGFKLKYNHRTGKKI